MNPPFLSILIPTWNRPESLSCLVSEINKYDHDDIEIVVVDNNSSEQNWLQLVKITKLHSNVRLFRNVVNIGMTPNWNKTIEYARGEWLCFVCDDDMFIDGALKRFRTIIKSFREPCLILQASDATVEMEVLSAGIETTNKIPLPPASGQFWHSSITQALGGFDERIKYCPDAEFWLRIAYHYPVLKVKEYFVHPSQHDTNYMWEAFRSADFIEQVSLSIALCCKYLIASQPDYNENVQLKVNDGIWETMRTVLNNTFLKKGKMQNFQLYLTRFVVLSFKLGRKQTMVKTLLNLPLLRAKEIFRNVYKSR